MDAKGRVSLPSSIRTTVERKLQKAEPDAELERIVQIGPHERLTMLQGFDATYLDRLEAELERRVADIPAADQRAAFEKERRAAFGTVEGVSFDSNGRMVLPAGLRRRAEITELAYFVGLGSTFEIWDPECFRKANADDQRQIDLLDDLLADRAARGRG